MRSPVPQKGAGLPQRCPPIKRCPIKRCPIKRRPIKRRPSRIRAARKIRALRGTFRFRVWPETAVGLTLAGKKPGAGLEPQPEDLAFSGQPGSDMRPYDRLIGAALEGDRWLFARQDTVEAAWRVVDPVLGDVTPVHPYARGSWGPKEADRLLAGGDTWHNPAADR